MNKLELTKQESIRLWKWEQFIPHNKYKKIDRKLLLKIRNIINKKTLKNKQRRIK